MLRVLRLVDGGNFRFLVVKELEDAPDVWALVAEFPSLRQARHYRDEVAERNRTLEQ